MTATAQQTLTQGVWKQIGEATTQVIITPLLPKITILVRYAAIDPGATVETGHIFVRGSEVSNAVLGSANTDAIWVMALEADVDIEVTVL